MHMGEKVTGMAHVVRGRSFKNSVNRFATKNRRWRMDITYIYVDRYVNVMSVVL